MDQLRAEWVDRLVGMGFERGPAVAAAENSLSLSQAADKAFGHTAMLESLRKQTIPSLTRPDYRDRTWGGTFTPDPSFPEREKPTSNEYRGGTLFYVAQSKYRGDDAVPRLAHLDPTAEVFPRVIKSITVRRWPHNSALRGMKPQIDQGDPDYPIVGDYLVATNYNGPHHLLLGRITGFGRDTRPTDVSYLAGHDGYRAGRHPLLGFPRAIAKSKLRSNGLSVPEPFDYNVAIETLKTQAPQLNNLKIYYEQNHSISVRGHAKDILEGSEIRVVPNVALRTRKEGIVSAVIASGRQEESSVKQLPYEAWRKVLNYM